MKISFFTLVTVLALSAPIQAEWWAENDYSFGSGGLSRESFSVFDSLAGNLVVGGNAAMFKNAGVYRDRIFSLRAPLMYSTSHAVFSLKPFVYPASGQIRSSAGGAKAYVMLPVGERDPENYLHLTISAAAARQKTYINAAGLQKTSLNESSFEIQAEKNFFNQFYFLTSAAGFMKSGNANNSNLINPAMDHGDMAYFGTFLPVTRLPEWTMTMQFARSMAPTFDSHIYLGFSRISYRSTEAASSFIGGMKIKYSEKSGMDLVYNYLKTESRSGQNFYKLLIQYFF